MHTIDINCDMGEGVGNDAALMPFISSANIACGYHAGDEKTMWQTIELALQHSVAIGAHVSFLDRENFGRTLLDLPLAEIYDQVMQQLILISEIAESFDVTIGHVKPHGALYNLSAADRDVAHTIARCVNDFNPALYLFGLSGSHSISAAAALGLKTASEAFADRGYRSDGSLVPRSEAGALIETEQDAVQQVLQIIREGTVTGNTGSKVPVEAQTICIHGDGPHAETFARSIHRRLLKEKISLNPLRS